MVENENQKRQNSKIGTKGSWGWSKLRVPHLLVPHQLRINDSSSCQRWIVCVGLVGIVTDWNSEMIVGRGTGGF